MIKAFQTPILVRALGEKGVKELYEQYLGACVKVHGPKEPTAKQIRLANLYKQFGRTEAARKAGVDPSLVDHAMNRVARWEWFKK